MAVKITVTNEINTRLLNYGSNSKFQKQFRCKFKFRKETRIIYYDYDDQLPEPIPEEREVQVLEKLVFKDESDYMMFLLSTTTQEK